MVIFLAVAPKIDRKNLGKRTIHAGQLLKVEAEVTGEPDPKVTWSLQDQPVKNNRIIIENEEHLTTCIVKKAERSDTGVYKIVAKNDSGTDVADLDLIVTGMENTT